MYRAFSFFAIAVMSLSLVAPTFAQTSRNSSSSDPLTLPDKWVDLVKFRSIGPANMMGRITSVAVYEKDPSTWWAASASGGLIKTVNNGTTFEHQFDDQSTVSIGDVQVSQSDPNIVWVGTGEANPRNSVSWGDGVYKSTDGGKTWKNMGLKKGFQTGRIAIHPTDPNTVYVGVLGRLWGPSEDRGLYKTTDGGENWKKVLFVDDKTGIIDLQMNPKDPKELMVATYERQRDGFDGNDPGKKYGAGSGIYKTTDGGESFTKIAQGLPTCKMGRIGIQYYRKNPKYVYAIIESEKIGQAPKDYPYFGARAEEAEVGLRLTTITRNSPAAKAELKRGDILLEIGGEAVKSPEDLTTLITKKHKAGDDIKLKISRERENMEITVKLERYPQRGASSRGGRGGRGGGSARGGRGGSTRSSVRTFVGTLGGQSANHQGEQWHDEGVPEEEYGGIYMSSDGGDSWKRINSLNPRPMYYSQFRVDPSDRNYMYVLGTSLYRSKDGGKTFVGDGHRGVGGGGSIHVDHHAMWIDPNDGEHMILGNDGGVYITHDRMDTWDHYNHAAFGQFYHVGLGPGRDYSAYGGLQDNGSWGGKVHNRSGGPLNTDWIRVGGGDGFICLVDPNDKDQIYTESQNGAMGSINLRTGQRGSARPRAQRGVRYRFNWKTPFILSPHNSRIHYSAGNFVFRSLNKGNGSVAISPEITNTNRGAGSAISESAVSPGVIYVGTTDGAVWMTRDGGKKWEPLFLSKGEDMVASKEQPDASENKPKVVEVKPAETPVKTVNKEGIAAIKKAVAGAWTGEFGRGEFTLNLKVDAKGKITGVFERGGRGETEISEGKFDIAKKSLYLFAETDNFTIEFECELDGNSMTGEMSFNEGQFVREFEATRDDDGQEMPVGRISNLERLFLQHQASDDPVSGSWEGSFIAEFIPEGRGNFGLDIKMTKSGEITGTYSSSQGEGEIIEGSYDEKSGKLSLTGENDDVQLEFKGSLKKGKFTGSIDVNGGQFTVDFEATKKAAAKTDAVATSTTQDKAADPKQEEKKQEDTAEAKPETKQEDQPSPSGEKKDDEPKAPTGKGSLAAQMPGPRWVSSLEASKFRPGRCYVSFDGHRSNDDEPYIFVTENYGKTWTSIRANLPTTAGSVRCIREDVKNQNLLYLGCEFSAWVSIDRGKSWTKFSGGFPTVAVHEIAVHPTAGEIVMGTHGRSLWVADVTVLQQLTSSNLSKDATLFQPNSYLQFRRKPERGSSGTRKFVGQNRPNQVGIFYHLGKEAESATITISDVRGRTMRTQEVTKTEGLHVFNWDFRRSAPQTGGRGGRGFRGGGGGRFSRGGSIAAGTYLVTLNVDGAEMKQTLEVIADPTTVRSGVAAENSELFFEFEQALMGLGEEGSDDSKKKNQIDF